MSYVNVMRDGGFAARGSLLSWRRLGARLLLFISFQTGILEQRYEVAEWLLARYQIKHFS